MPGLYFEEFDVGQTFEHPIRRTVTEADNMLFSVMTMNPQPLHIDAEFAAGTEFGQRLVNSLFTLGLMIGQSVGDTTLGTTIANLGMSDVAFPQAGLPRRYDTDDHAGPRQAREQVPARCRHRRVRAYRPQPAQRAGRDLPPQCADEEAVRQAGRRMRSLLFVPADSEKKLAKALGTGADVLLLDLEDSVAAARKPAGRVMAHDFLKARPKGARAYVRINPLATEFAPLDLEAVMPARPDGIMLPKASGGDEVRTLDRMLDALEKANGLTPGTTQILPIVTETARAMFTLGTYAGASTRLSGLMWGAEDLAADIGALANRRPDATYEAPFALARSLCLFAAAAAGVAAVDTVYADFRDRAGFERECQEGARLGFTAKATIHPDQVEIINRVFTPDAKAIEHAQRVVNAFAKAPEAGVVNLDGMMVDRPHYAAARRVLERAGRPAS